MTKGKVEKDLRKMNEGKLELEDSFWKSADPFSQMFPSFDVVHASNYDSHHGATNVVRDIENIATNFGNMRLSAAKLNSERMKLHRYVNMILKKGQPPPWSASVGRIKAVNAASKKIRWQYWHSVGCRCDL